MNPNLWETGNVYSATSNLNFANIEVPCLSPDTKSEYNRLSDFEIKSLCTKTPSKTFPKLEGESLPTDPLNTSENLLTSQPVALMDTKDLLAKVKEEIPTQCDLNSV